MFCNLLKGTLSVLRRLCMIVLRDTDPEEMNL